jgi:Zn-dependent peptidase ImmA (M78 family)/transcriptional regulator with XRE-family HTH domain
MIYGDRVRQMREMHRLTQSDLSATIPDLSQSQLSRIESDLAPDPGPETMALLSAVLGVTSDFFERRPAPSLVVHSPHFRARSRLTSAAKESAMQWARLIYEEYVHLRRSANLIPVRLQRCSNRDPTQAAHEVRKALGFTESEPLAYLVLALERMGIIFLGLPVVVDDLDAFSAWCEDEPVIALAGQFPGDRLRFSAAHELGHLVLHGPQERGREVEVEADAFAAELLTPLVAMSRAFPRRPTLGNLTMLKTEWGVSIRSLIRRARELEIIDQPRAVSLYKQISARGWNRAEPGYVPDEKPRAFRKLAEISYGPGPNMQRFASDADWSEELAFRVLEKHARPDELPHHQAPQSQENVIEFPAGRTGPRVHGRERA